MTQRERWGATGEGVGVELLTLRNLKGTAATVATYGATLVRLQHGSPPTDLVLGFDRLGGYLSSQPYLGATESMLAAMSLDDIWLGEVKSVLFGWVIALSGSFTGFHSGKDARSVGAAATRAVVASIFCIVVLDSIVTTAWTVAR